MRKILLVIICLLITGCYNYSEINDLAIVSTLALNYQDDNYEMILEIKESNKDSTNSSYIIEGTGQTIAEAFNNASISLDKNLYFINMDILMITPGIAETSLKDIFNFIENQKFAYNFNIVLTDNPSDAIDIILNQDEVFGERLKNMFDISDNNVINISYPELLEKYLSSYYQPILPILNVEDEELIINEAAIFNDHMISYIMNFEEVAIYNILNNYPTNHYFKINNNLRFQATGYQTKIFYEIDTLMIDVNINGVLSETNKDELETSKELVKNYLNHSIKDLFLVFQDYNSDPLGLKKIIYNTTREKISLCNIPYQVNTKVTFQNRNMLESIGENNEKDY